MKALSSIIFFSERYFALRIPPQAEFSVIQCERRADDSVKFRGMPVLKEKVPKRVSIENHVKQFPQYVFNLSWLYSSGYRVSSDFSWTEFLLFDCPQLQKSDMLCR